MLAKKTKADEPRYIIMHDTDKVAIVLNDGGLPAGTVFPDGLTQVDCSAQGHKIALRDLTEGEATIEDVGGELCQLMPDVASGKKRTWAEQWKLHNALTLFNPTPVA
jgi:hypothetical protein